MLLISVTIKNVFKSVFFLLMLVEILLLGIILIIYRKNTLSMSEDVKQNSKSVVINYRDLFNLYLKNKYILLIDDLVLFMQSYEGIIQYRSNTSSNNYFNKFNAEYINSKCSIQGSSIPDNSIYNSEWYDVSSKELSQRLYGSWFNGEEYKTYESLLQEDKERIINLCALNEVLSRLLSKHLRWLDFLGSTVQYWTFSFSSSLFYKFPVYFNSYMQSDWKDPFINSSCRSVRKKEKEYDPKCRPFYNETLIDSSNIVITKPYKYVTTLNYGSDICIKSLSKSKINQNGKSLPDLMTCIGFNFNDVQIYRNQIENTLGANKRVFIVYYAENEINVLFNSEFYPSNYVSWGKYFNLNNNEENNFFESYIQNTMLRATKDQKTSNDTLRNVYPEIKDFYESNISNKLINMIQNYQNPYLNFSKINITNYRDFDEKEYYFSINQAFEFDNSSSSLYLSSKIYQNFYLFPIPISFDYTGNYLLKVSQNSKFYIIFIDEQHQKFENVSLFFSIISYEIFLYFFFLIGINTLIWVIFGLIYYYFFKGFFMPLNQINNIYKELFLRGNSIVPKDDLPSNGSFHTGKKYNNFIEKFVTKWISTIFRLNEYQEIHDCLITLKILKIIRSFDDISTKSLKLNYYLGRRETHLENIVDAFLYLMHEISLIYLENPNIDINIVVNLIQGNFIYRINSTDDREEVEVFYEDINIIVDHVLNKKNARRLSNAIRRSSSLRMSVKSSTELLTRQGSVSSPKKDSFFNKNIKRSSIGVHEFEKELKYCFGKLKENLQYKYCIFKMKNLDSKLSNHQFNEDYLDCEYNSDDENFNNKGWENYANYDEEYCILNKNSYTRNRNQESGNHTNYKKKEKLQLEDDILTIVNEFNRYFVISNEEEPDNSFHSLKHIAAYITQASLLFQINNETDGIRQCILAMEKIRTLQNKIVTLGKMTKFAYLIICSLLFERILYLLANLSEKCDQKKTQFFIYLNMLDLGPVYDRKIRSNILQKLLDFLNRSGLDFQKQAKISPFEHFDKEDGFLNIKLVRHKVRALLNMSITYSKNVLFLLDLNLPFLKDNNFQKILLKPIIKEKHFFYFSCFDEKLYIYRNKNNIDEIQNEDLKSDNEIDIINILNNEESIDNISKNSETILNDCNSPYEFLEFLNNYKRLDTNINYFNQPRLDLSIRNVLKFYNFKDYPKNNNFLIVLTSIDAAFSFNRDNLIRISQTLYDTQYSIILCILNDERIYTEEKYQRKLQCYKKFIEENIINGHLFILKSFSLLKYIINCISPNKLKEFDVLTMKTFLESIDLNFVEKKKI